MQLTVNRILEARSFSAYLPFEHNETAAQYSVPQKAKIG